LSFGKITGRIRNNAEGLRTRPLSQPSTWVYPDGDLGGFTIQQMLYCNADGACGPLSADQLTAARDWARDWPEIPLVAADDLSARFRDLFGR
jgi:hypothetical protein